MKRAILAAAFAAILVLVAAACGGGGGKASEGGTTTIAGQDANDHGTKDVSGEDEIDLELDDFYFEPTILRGSPGQKVKIDLENEGQVEHNLTIDDQSIDEDVEPGDRAEVEVTIPQSGTVLFYCKYHRGQAMAGALEASSGG